MKLTICLNCAEIIQLNLFDATKMNADFSSFLSLCTRLEGCYNHDHRHRSASWWRCRWYQPISNLSFSLSSDAETENSNKQFNELGSLG